MVVAGTSKKFTTKALTISAGFASAERISAKVVFNPVVIIMHKSIGTTIS